MEQATPAVRNLAQLLLTLEASRGEHTAQEVDTVLSVFERLRSYLSKLVGVAGFQVLLARALALARPEAVWLKAVQVRADATLEGFGEAAQQQPAEVIAVGSAALLAHLLQLLITFIGEALTLRLVRDVWPEARLDAVHLGAEETRHE